MPIIIDDEEKQSQELEILYQKISQVLQHYGEENAFGRKDYWLLDDNYGGYAQHKFYINNIALLKTPFVELIQQILEQFPSWEIIVTVDVPGMGETWPPMGLIIRAHEIVDGLQRQYFPSDYRSVFFRGSRPGTDRD